MACYHTYLHAFEREGWLRGRKPRSVNRQVRNVVAGLNFAVTQRGHIGNREDWKLVHLVDDGEENVAVFLTEEQRNRLIAAAPKAPDGGHWEVEKWSIAIRAAAEIANNKAKKPLQRIPLGVSAYSFRHTRISELLQRYGVDPLTVAAQCGTSLVMIEKY